MERPLYLCLSCISIRAPLFIEVRTLETPPAAFWEGLGLSLSFEGHLHGYGTMEICVWCVCTRADVLLHGYPLRIYIYIYMYG